MAAVSGSGIGTGGSGCATAAEAAAMLNAAASPALRPRRALPRRPWDRTGKRIRLAHPRNVDISMPIFQENCDPASHFSMFHSPRPEVRNREELPRTSGWVLGKLRSRAFSKSREGAAGLERRLQPAPAARSAARGTTLNCPMTLGSRSITANSGTTSAVLRPAVPAEAGVPSRFGNFMTGGVCRRTDHGRFALPRDADQRSALRGRALVLVSISEVNSRWRNPRGVRAAMHPV